MLDVPADTRLDLDAEPALADGVRVLAGSRAPGTCTPCPARRTTSSPAGGRCSATAPGWPSRDEAVASGVFGPVDDALAARIGDVVALARGSWALVTPVREPGPSRLAAYHGSLTATELAIPLLAARGPGLALVQGHVPAARVRGMGRPAGEPAR